MQTQPFIALSDLVKQQTAEAIVRSCVHCGFCNATCPTYQLLGDERDGPRGRIYLIKQVLEGARASVKSQVHLDRCLTCRACETTCPSGVRYGELLDIGRDVIEQQVGRSWLAASQRWLLTRILPNAKLFNVGLKLARGVSPFLPKKWAAKLPPPKSAVPVASPSLHARQVLLAAGCVQASLAPDINAAVVKILDKLGITVVTASQEGCCGALSFHLSDQAHGLDFMRRNIDAWIPYLDNGIDTIISTASGCGVMIKDYARLLANDTEYQQRAARVSQACKDIVEVLEQEDLALLNLCPTAQLAFHAPCTLQHGQKLTGRVENLLTRLGLQLTPVAHAQSCCGAAGTYSLLQPALAQQLLDAKLQDLTQGAPAEIATANIGCLLHLQAQSALPVRHWVVTVAENLA